MVQKPYERFHNKELILRDELAIDRTLLANERTVLAYFRGALTLVIVGVTFAHFFDKGLLPYLGILFVPFGVGVGTLGYYRYRKMNKAIRSIRASLTQQVSDKSSAES